MVKISDGLEFYLKHHIDKTTPNIISGEVYKIDTIRVGFSYRTDRVRVNSFYINEYGTIVVKVILSEKDSIEVLSRLEYYIYDGKNVKRVL